MKVFGTGMQRTGTTSLAKALNHLGIKTRDHPRELHGNLDHPLLQEYEGFTDNPIPLIYKELDARFPGSRFIHTERDEAAWLKSVEWLHTTGAVKFHWHAIPGLAEINQALYGRIGFDADVFRDTYRRHNREVRAHFADRPDDLLILDITQGEGFEKICPFLGRPAPAESFPHWNKQEKVWKVKFRKVLKQLRRG